MHVIIQKLPEHLGVSFVEIRKWYDNGLIYPTSKNEAGFDLFNVDAIQKALPDIESKMAVIDERQNMEARVKSIATELEAATARARQTGNHDLILRAQILGRQKRELAQKLAPIAKAPDIGALRSELDDVRQARAEAEAKAKQNPSRDNIFDFQRLDRRTKELQALIRNAK